MRALMLWKQASEGLPRNSVQIWCSGFQCAGQSRATGIVDFAARAWSVPSLQPPVRGCGPPGHAAPADSMQPPTHLPAHLQSQNQLSVPSTALSTAQNDPP